MTEERTCPHCGKPVPPTALEGICPECMLKAGVATGTESDGRTPPFTPPTLAELAGKFPQLEILELIGRGGMGAVYKARQKELDRIVALKILPPAVGDDAAFAERFTREARALARLSHSNIVTLYEFGRADGLFFFLMEFVDGINLRQLLQAGRLSTREALAIVPQICDALQYAHDQGIVHRDMKPENVLLDRRGRVKVADFGLAKLVGTDASGTLVTPSLSPSGGGGFRRTGEGESSALTEGKVMGTPNYMAPEQVERPSEVDHRADIYALGVVFYQMLTGELPGKRIEPPSRKVLIDVRLDEVVLRALEKKPELRYQQAGELKTEVETIAATAVLAKDAPAPPGSAQAEVAGRRRFPLLIAAGAIVLIVVLAVAALLFAHLAHKKTMDGPNPAAATAKMIQDEVGRQLREAGATYDDLKVTVAEFRDRARPFMVSYRGLRNFNYTYGGQPDPKWPASANGQFVMNYIGAGQWQGALGDRRFTVQVGHNDNIELPFINDPQVIGEWESVDFVAKPAFFNPDKRSRPGGPRITRTFLENGKMPEPWLTWTKGVLVHHGDKTASRYQIREIKGQLYLFLEQKSGVPVSGMEPSYDVLKKKVAQ